MAAAESTTKINHLLYRVYTDKVCSDSYDADGLRHGVNGFMSERFISPPVFLFFVFSVPVNICRIEIIPFLRSHFSTVFDLSTLRPNVLSPSFDIKNFETCMSDLVNGFRNNFSTVARFQCESSAKPIVSIALENHQSAATHRVNFYPNQKRFLNHVQVLCLRILRSTGVPCLGSVVFIGKPCIPPEIVMPQFQRNITSDLSSVRKTAIPSNPDLSIQKEDHKVHSSVVDNDTQVCSDFIDAITLNIMRTPILLPSGTNIDSSTLEKYTQEEQRWSRPPSDPFTGIPFTGSTKPVFNYNLKVRIDQFLSSCQSKALNPKHSIDLSEGNSRVKRPRLDTEKIGLTQLCCSCKGEPNDLYRLSCKDLLCRECLNKDSVENCRSNRIVCPACYVVTSSKDVLCVRSGTCKPT